MGYRPQRKVYKLVFADEEMNGLEVRARSITTGEALSVDRLMALGRSGQLTEEGTKELFDLFSSALVSWNIEDDDGQPVPPTREGLMTLEVGFSEHVISEWISAITSVPAPLGPRSPSGEPFQEASLPMAPLPSSRAS